ncbi:MAG: hypothetical protein K9J06_09455 [Flavobacteriales bacterium]|nr:hypothetical protein [Flavobacteriales bacterium]
MKKAIVLLVFAAVSFGTAHAQNNEAASTAQPSPKAVNLSPTMQQTTPAAAVRRNDAEATAPRSIVMTDQQVDEAIAHIEQQMTRLEGSEGYNREHHLKQIEALNNRRPKH